MTSSQNQARLPIVGYTDRLSVTQGEKIRVMVSCDAPEYELDVVRLIHGHPSPAGPGFKERVVPASIAGKYRGKRQELRPGSYVIVPDDPGLRLTGSFTIQAWIYPTTANKALQAIITKWSPAQNSGYGLFVGEDGCLGLWLGGEGGQVAKVSSGVPLSDLQWYFVAAAYDEIGREVTLLQRPLTEWPPSVTAQVRRDSVHLTKLAANSVPLLIAAAWQPDPTGSDRPAFHFNGKIGNPSLFQRNLNSAQIDALAHGQSPRQLADALLASWDFSVGIGTSTVTDISGHELPGKTVNLPARGVTGHNWKGREINFAQAPGEYGAIHFHEDDLADAQWEVAAELTIPPTMASGVYAVRLDSSHGEWHVPFFVRPHRGTASSHIAFLAPTFSYLAYANMHSGVPGLLSLYDYHCDGTGVRYASRFRPLLDLNPKYLKFHGEDGRTYGRHFCADLSLIDWMDANHFSYDVITDDDLHREGQALLRPYSVVLTGSHPEYYSEQMLDGLQSYLRNGGRLMYLGGNGFYWVTSAGSEWPYPLEVRRWGGTETWGSAPGEYHHSTTGELGGLWRNRGRAPQSLVGVGFCADGWLDEPPQTCAFARPYRRTPESHDPRAAFIFEGVASDALIGDFESLSLGCGAAGDEVDRAEPLFGSPPHSLCVAAATGFQRHYHAVEERHYAARFSIEDSTVRSDMVYLEYPRGGAVFSVGSIGWSGSLYFNSYDNNVSRITRNVLTKFMQKNNAAIPGEEPE
jgi:N,N-dimethylformamidase